jgi:hypothetical protein
MTDREILNIDEETYERLRGYIEFPAIVIIGTAVLWSLLSSVPNMTFDEAFQWVSIIFIFIAGFGFLWVWSVSSKHQQ